MDSFEKNIRRKFDGYKVQPSEDLWQRISADLPKSGGFVASKAVAYAVAVTVAAVAVFVFVFFDKDKQVKNQVISIPSEIVVPNVINREVASDLEEASKPKPKTKVYYAAKPHEQKPVNYAATTHGANDEICIDIMPGEDTVNFTGVNRSECLTPDKYKFRVRPYKGCAPLVVRMEISGLKGFEDLSWYVDQVKVSVDSVLIHTFDAGSHVVSLVISSGEESLIIVDTIEVDQRPQAEFTYDSAVVANAVNFMNLSTNATQYQWDFGDGTVSYKENPSHVYLSEGLYRVVMIASGDNCSDTVVKYVKVEPKEVNIIFPNAFIPSKSGSNGGYYNPNQPDRSVFYPKTRKPVEDYRLEIYDRTGTLLFTSNDINIGWDGYYKNKPVPVGVYVYIAKGHFVDGEEFYLKGDVTVIYGN